MNKLLHAIVYLILIVAVAALVFEKSLFDKRTLLGDRNRAMEDYIVRLARTIEKADAPRPMSIPEAKKDISPIEARQVDTPEMENVLEEYPAQLEAQNLETFNWDNSATRLQLRQLYYLGPDGQPVPDAANYNKPMMKGKGTMADLMDQLFERAKAQQATLNNTRAALAEVRGKLETMVSEYNKLKPDARILRMTEDELKQKINQLGQEKQTLEEQVAKLKSRVEEQAGEITSVKDELATAKDDADVMKEENAALDKKVKQLQKLMQQMAQQQNRSSSAAGGLGSSAVTSLPAGEKGNVIAVDNKLMFCVVQFSEDAMKELLGPELQGALPQLEMFVKRAGFQGPAKDIVGRIRLRQNVQGGNFVIADILGDWQQTEAMKGDVVFPCEK